MYICKICYIFHSCIRTSSTQRHYYQTTTENGTIAEIAALVRNNGDPRPVQSAPGIPQPTGGRQSVEDRQELLNFQNISTPEHNSPVYQQPKPRDMLNQMDVI